MSGRELASDATVMESLTVASDKRKFLTYDYSYVKKARVSDIRSHTR